MQLFHLLIFRNLIQPTSLILYKDIDPFTLSLLSEEYKELNHGLSLDYNEEKWFSMDSCVRLSPETDCKDAPLLIKFENGEPVTVTFNYGIRGVSYYTVGAGQRWEAFANRGYYKIDDGSEVAFSANKNKRDTYITRKFSVLFQPGAHSIEIGSYELSNDIILNEFNITEKNNNSSGGATNGFTFKLNIQNRPFDNKEEYILDNDNTVIINNLLPHHTYWARTRIESHLSENDYNNWGIKYSPIIKFVTDSIEVTARPVSNIKQASVSLNGSIICGDAIVKESGFQLKKEKSSTWITIPIELSESCLQYNQTRLRPATRYQYRAFCIPEHCDSVFSEVACFETLPVVAVKPILTKLSQHQVILSGKVIYGDANIYQRGMQFRKKGTDNWDEVEEAGNDSIYTLVRKNLEMGTTYQARTYVQPAGCEVIYSDILEFTTLDNYFISCNSNERTQTSVTFVASLADTDDDVSINYGFEYYIDSDGFYENADSFEKSDVMDVPVIPTDKVLKTKITQLCPSLGIRWRAYAIIDGNKVYYTSSKNLTWNFAGTDRAIVKATVRNITQTSISLNLDVTQTGDAEITQIEYALANSPQDTQAYSVCGNVLTISNLSPDTQYNLRFRGLVNNRYCPLLNEISWDYSWFEYNTLPVTVDVSFTNITQTKATMKVNVNAGDAEVTDLKYSMNYGEYTDCGETENFSGLTPGTQYTIRFSGKVNGTDCYWETQPNTTNAYKFTTKAVSSYISISDISQTSAKIKCSSNYGDATYLSSGLELGSLIFNSENKDFEKIITELLPGQQYTCRSFVETEEGGRVYSSSRTFTTKNIECGTLPVSNISNRSATMNGMIECDSYSSAEFGFQWKQMVGWVSDPAFTKGRKLDDGTISVALANGMLEPNTDYQYRTAVRYQGNIYYSTKWETFRTESEFVYYPASVYTLFRTDRENNALILCGYYVAGSETIISQGYEYWQTGGSSYQSARTSQTPSIINTDESMQYEFTPGELPSGNYNVRAFVKTESGATIYGATVGFTSSADGYSGIEIIESELPHIVAEGGVVKVYNANQLNCIIYSVNGQILANTIIDNSYYEFRLTPGNFIIVTLSNGLTKKIKI